MKKLILILLPLLALLTGCSKKATDVVAPAVALTEAEKKNIVTAYENISTVADKMLLDIPTDKLQTAFEAKAAEFKKQTAVENVNVTSSAMFIKFKKGGVVSWMYNPADKDLPLDDLQSITPEPQQELIQSISTTSTARIAAAEYPGNKKVCIINQMSNNWKSENRKVFFNILEKKFIANGYTVDRIDNEQMTIDFMKTQLNKYGVLLISTHGAYDVDNNKLGYTTLVTGEQPMFINAVSVANFLADTAKWYRDGLIISKLRVNEVTSSGVKENGSIKLYYGITDRFISSNYSNFPNSAVFLASCKSSLNPIQMPAAFKGAKIVTGWSNDQNISYKTSTMVLYNMLKGFNYTESLEKLEPSDKSQTTVTDKGITIVANFVPTPATLDYRLVPPKITLTKGENIALNGLDLLDSYCAHDYIMASSWTYQGRQAPMRAIVRFDIPNSLKDNKLKSAKLILKSYMLSNNNNINHAQNDNTLDIIRVPTDWKCSTVNWNNQPTMGSTMVTLPNVGILTGTNDNPTVDVTALVQEMIQNGNYGFLFKMRDEQSVYHSRWFGSFSSPAGFKPILEIEIQ